MISSSVRFRICGESGTVEKMRNHAPRNTDVKDLRPAKRALSGMLVACVRANGKAGPATVTCTGKGLESGSVTFLCE